MYRAITVICLLGAIGAALHYRQQARNWRTIARQRATELQDLGGAVGRDLRGRRVRIRDVAVTDLRPGTVVDQVPIIGRFSPGRIVDAHGERVGGVVQTIVGATAGGRPMTIRFVDGDRVYVRPDARADVVVSREAV